MENAKIDLDPLGRLPTACSLAWATGGPRPPFRDKLLLRQIAGLDPILYFRALRLWSAIHRPSQDALPPLPEQLLEELGPVAVERLLSTPARPARDPAPLLRLWWHSIASASAARSLAELAGSWSDVSPEQAFLHGLLHDLGRWSQVACEVGLGDGPLMGPLTWTSEWQVPCSIRTCWLAAEAGTIETKRHRELARYVLAGEALADLAIGNVAEHESKTEMSLLAELTGGDVDSILGGLRKRIDKTLAPARLSYAKLGVEPRVADYERFHPEQKTPPPIEKAILELLELSGSESQRKLLDVLVTAGAKYLDFDRAVFFQWVGNSREGLFRAACDASRSVLTRRRVRPNAHETVLLGRSAGSGHPVTLYRREGLNTGLVQEFGVDEIFAVPVASGGQIHGFLLLDHAYSPDRRVQGSVATRALAFAGVAAQNLSTLHLRRRQERTQREAHTDHLTGLCNRRAAMQSIYDEIERAREHGFPLSLLMLDLDHFKKINDVHGHLTGDKVLAAVGQILRDHVRETDLAARVGGEEFLVIEPGTSLQDASLVAARISRAVEERGERLGVSITISVGATGLRDGDTVDSLLARADRALYASKSLGRNRFSIDAE